MAIKSRLFPRGLPARPPITGNPSLDDWIGAVSDAFDGLPLSYFSTSDGPETSAVSAPRGFLGIEIGSSRTTTLWVKTSSGTTGWLGLG